MLNNLERLFENAATDTAPLPAPTGSRKEIAAELIRRCRERDASFEKQAVEAERANDADACWIAMACRAENKRFWDRIERDMAAELEVAP